MIRVAMVLALLLLAQSIDGRSRPVTSGSHGAHVDRHVDAHVDAPQGTPAASPSERTGRESAPGPAVGTGTLQSPQGAPPAIQPYRDPLYRDPLYRDRR